MSFHIGDRPTKSIPFAVFNADFPSAFDDNQWDITANVGAEESSIELVIISIPSGNGLLVSDIEYRIDGGAAVSLGDNSPGIYTIPGFNISQTVNIELRTVTRKGVSDWSNVKSVVFTPDEPDAFGPEDWDLVSVKIFNGEDGFFLRADSDTLFTDTEGTTLAETGQVVAAWLDESPNETSVTQTEAGERPEYQDDPDRLLIAEGKRMIADVPAITGTMVIATDEGTAAYGVDVSAGDYLIGRNAGDYFPGSELLGHVLIDRELSPSEIESVRQFFIERGAGDDYSGVTDFTEYWRGRDEITVFPFVDTSNGTIFFRAWLSCTNLTSFPLLDVSSGTNFQQAWQVCSSLISFPLLDVSNGTNFERAWQGCSSLTSFPELDVSSGEDFERAWFGCSSLISFPELDVSSGTTFREAWGGCSSLENFPAGRFDSVTATNFTEAFINTNLTEESIDNILVSINAANTSNGTFDQSGGSAPSAVGEAAIDALVARGWTVNVTGGYTP